MFSNDILYDTDKIIVKQKKFTDEEVEKALFKHLHSNPVKNRGKIIELLNEMLAYDLDDVDEMGIAIQETLLFEQMKLYGLREFVFSKRFKSIQRYFNPQATIVFELLK